MTYNLLTNACVCAAWTGSQTPPARLHPTTMPGHREISKAEWRHPCPFVLDDPGLCDMCRSWQSCIFSCLVVVREEVKHHSAKVKDECMLISYDMEGKSREKANTKNTGTLASRSAAATMTATSTHLIFEGRVLLVHSLKLLL